WARCGQRVQRATSAAAAASTAGRSSAATGGVSNPASSKSDPTAGGWDEGSAVGLFGRGGGGISGGGGGSRGAAGGAHGGGGRRGLRWRRYGVGFLEPPEIRLGPLGHPGAAERFQPLPDLPQDERPRVDVVDRIFRHGRLPHGDHGCGTRRDGWGWGLNDRVT